MLHLGIFLASAGPIFEKNLLKPFAIFSLPVTLFVLSLNWVGYSDPFGFLLIRAFKILHVSFMFVLFNYRRSE